MIPLKNLYTTLSSLVEEGYSEKEILSELNKAMNAYEKKKKEDEEKARKDKERQAHLDDARAAALKATSDYIYAVTGEPMSTDMTERLTRDFKQVENFYNGKSNKLSYGYKLSLF